MQQFTSFLRRAAVLLALVGLSGAALAGPIYHVSINTTPLASYGSGTLELAMNQAGGAQSSLATISNLSGDFLDPSAPILLSADSGFDAVDRAVNFGGLLSFDVEFSGGFLDTAGDAIMFSAALFDANWTTYLGADMNLVEFTLTSDGVSPAVLTDLAAVRAGAAVPEASQWAIFLTGLSLMAWTVRRRQQR